MTLLGFMEVCREAAGAVKGGGGKVLMLGELFEKEEMLGDVERARERERKVEGGVKGEEGQGKGEWKVCGCNWCERLSARGMRGVVY